MYHDQGLIPVKLLAFDQAVNVTLGLPIIRTSPDHGTAFDIVGLEPGQSGKHAGGDRTGNRSGDQEASPIAESESFAECGERKVSHIWTDTLANLATTVNNGGYGVTAALDSTGTILTFTANAGNTSTAVVASSGTVTDTSSLHTAAVFTAGTTAIKSISVQGAGDTISTGVAANLLVTGTPAGGSAHTDTIALGGGQTLTQIMNTINTTNDTGIRATLNQAGTTLTFTPVDGTSADSVTLSGSTIVDNVAAVNTTAAVVPQNGTLGTMTERPSAGNKFSLAPSISRKAKTQVRL